MIFVLAAACSLFAGLDGYLTFERMKKYGPIVELNPMIRQIAEDFGLKVAVGTLMVFNLGLIVGAILLKSEALMGLLTGAKLMVCAMQLKSLQVESYIERILAKVREKQASKQ